MDKPRSIAPIIAAILLLLPVLYVGSYLALVVPRGNNVVVERSPSLAVWGERHYRLASEWVPRFYWPLEQIDRRLRPAAWESEDFFEGTIWE
jgi:hypothetical protein